MAKQHADTARKIWHKPELTHLGSVSDVAGKPTPLIQAGSTKS